MKCNKVPCYIFIMEENVFMNRFSVLREIIKYACAEHKGLMFVIILESIFSAFLSLTNLIGIGIVINALTLGQIEKIQYTILFYTGLNLAISLMKFLLSYIHSKKVREASDKIQLDFMRDGIIVNYHWAQDGSVLDMKKKSMSANPVFAFAHIGQFIDYICKFIGIVFIFSLLRPLFLFIIIASSAISVILTFKGRNIDFEHENNCVEDVRKYEYLYSLMTQYEYGKEIRINNLKSLITKKSRDLVNVYFKKLKKFLKEKLRINSILSVVAISQSIIMYLYFSYSVYTGEISIAQYSVLLGAVTLLSSILIGFFDNIAIINKMISRMDIFLEYKRWVKSNSNIYLTNENPKIDFDTSHFQIQFENVDFTYPGTDTIILKNINFTVEGGQRIGIVGLNGSGKTTLIKLILRLYEPTHGRILLNGTDISIIPLGEYLTHIGVVLQDFTIFAYSIKENILFDKESDANELKNAIKMSGLDKKIDSLDNGIDTVLYKELVENGIELSGGESQKLALARAVYRNADVLILDETTSTLDPVAEYEFYSNVQNFSSGKTTFFISHRLASTRFCDKLFVIDHGTIAETGTHDELMRNNKIYADLFESQAKYYRESGGIYEGSK